MSEREIRLHQCVHGYARGHELLAASIQLPAEDRDEVLRLSDLSGIPIAPQLPPYLTAYPLPSRNFYALAKTWGDDQAPRDGCVLTHTLLVPWTEWTRGYSARTLSAFFRRPIREALDDFRSPVETAAARGSEGPYWDARLQPSFEREFTRRYFAQGVSPIIWPIDDGGEYATIVLRLLDILWPTLRGEHTSCSYALQPRRSGNRPTDLMFVPRRALGRFSNLPDTSILGREASIDQPRDARETVMIERVVKLLLGDADSHGWPRLRELRELLPSDPRSLLRVAMLDDLDARGKSTPSALVAALDVWSALAPFPDAAVEAKDDAVHRAISRIAEEAPSRRIDLLVSVAERLAKSAFRLQEGARKEVTDALRTALSQCRQDILSALLSRTQPPRELVAAVASSFAVSDQAISSDIVSIAGADKNLLQSVFEYEPTLPRRVLVEAIESGSAQQINKSLQNIESWLSACPEPIARRSFASLSDQPAILHREGVLSNVSAVVGEAELFSFLSLPRLSDTPLQSFVFDSMLPAVRRNLASSREWYRREGVNTAVDAKLFVSTLSTQEDVLQVATSALAHTGAGALLDALAERRIRGEWAVEEIDGLLFVSLIKAAGAGLLDGSDSFIKFMRAVPSATIAANVSIESVRAIDDARLRRRVLGRSVEAIFEAFLQGGVAEEALTDWIEELASSAAGSAGEVRQTVDRGLKALRSGGNSLARWRLLRAVSSRFLSVDPAGVAQSIGVVFADSRHDLSDTHIHEWERLLSDAKANGASDILAVATTSLALALGQPTLPLGTIVVATFAPVYRSLPERRRAPLLFSMWDVFNDWDRRRDARRELIAAFLHSSWSPGDLALAAEAAGALDKVVSDLVDARSERYLERVVATLRQTGNGSLANQVRKLAEA